MMAKYPIGTRVFWDDWDAKKEREAEVLRHGYDHSGIYTEVRLLDNGEKVRIHRSQLKPSSVGYGGPL
jgi:hypothetical protein